MIHLISSPARSCLGTAILRKQLSRRGSTFSRTSLRSDAVASMPLAEDKPHTHTLLILGKPGGGKGTISGKILADFPSFQLMSTGDELRQHVRNQTAIGVEAMKYMDEGSLVPDNVMIKLVINDAMEAIKTGRSLLLDGFPRTLEQAKVLDQNLNVDLVVNLSIPNETIVGRISDRWIHPASGRVYSYSYKPPKVKGLDDETGELLVQREDDKPESALRRLQMYEDATAPLVNYYEEKGVCQTFRGTMSDVIYPEVKAWLDDQLAEDKVGAYAS